MLFKVEKNTEYCDDGQTKNIRKTYPQNWDIRNGILAASDVIAHNSFSDAQKYFTWMSMK